MEKEHQVKKLKVMGTEVVVQHNDFLESSKRLTLQEYKLFMFLISKVDPTSDELLVFRVTALEFAKAIGIENSAYIYRDLQAVTKRLMERVVTIHHPESQLLIQTHLLSSMHYWYGEGYVDIKISEDMRPYILNLKRQFTQYKLSQITKLSSVYAIKIYELLKKQETLGKRTFFIDDLRKKLNILNDKLKAIKDFRVYVLEIAKREINLKTDLEIDFEFIKSGRKIAAVQFDIRSKDEKTENKKTEEKEAGYFDARKDPEILRKIMNFGYSEMQAANMLTGVDSSDAKNAIEAVEDQIKKGNVKSSKAMIKTALKEKWRVDNSKKKSKEKAASGKTAKIEKTAPTVPRKTGFMKIFQYLFEKEEKHDSDQ
jgi:plasmid replication initiation protein